MPEDALEVDMLSVGDADCMLVTRWRNHQAKRLLIDGGERATVAQVKSKLIQLGATHLDYLLCTHFDADHAAGLVEIVNDVRFEIDVGYMHVVDRHTTLNEEQIVAKAAGVKEAMLITASVRTNNLLLQAFEGRGIDPVEPFAGTVIGDDDDFLVCGPSEAYYEEFIRKLEDKGQVAAIGEVMAESRMEKQASAAQPLKANPTDTPSNNSSTIITTAFHEKRLLFLADAGLEAQGLAQKYAKANQLGLGGLSWLQIPHHGSLNAINQAWVEYYRPTSAYVSADGVGHPKPAVIAAFKKVGTRVYGTHHPQEGDLRHRYGDTPDRPGYGPATPL